MYREETLLNVIRSVTRNGRSIILTAVLALILVYMFSIIGYIFFKDDFLVPVDDEIVVESDAKIFGSHMTHQQQNADGDESIIVEPMEQCSRPDTEINKIESGGGGGERKERACDSLVMCILTTLNQGLRNGGGIGDILRAPSSSVSVRNKIKKNNFFFAIFKFFFRRKHYLWHELYMICYSFSLSLLLC